MSEADPLSEFIALSGPNPRNLCKVGLAREKLTQQEQALLDAAVGDDVRVKCGAIVKWCKRRGHNDVTTSAVIHHRSGSCSCAKPTA